MAAAWVLAGVFSPEPFESVLRVNRLYQVALVFLVAEHAADARWAERALALYLVGVTVGASTGLVLWLSQSVAIPRMRGVFTNAMTSGNAHSMAIVGAVAATALWQGRKRVGAGVAGVIDILALVATQTRSSWLGAVFGTLTLFGRRSNRMWVAVGLLVFAVAIVANPAQRQRATQIANPHEETAQGRISLWLTGWELFCERPILGWGLSDHLKLIEAHRRPDAPFHGGHFHNNLVQVAVSTGMVGLAAYAAFHLALAAALWRRRQAALGLAALGVWVAFQVAGLFDWSFGDAEVAYAFFLWMGLGAAENREAESADR